MGQVRVLVASSKIPMLVASFGVAGLAEIKWVGVAIALPYLAIQISSLTT